MDTETLLALAGVAAAMTWTPGPNNVMLAASGANFGWRRTLAHSLGVSVGFPVMLFLVALGFGQIFAREPRLAVWLGWVGLAVVIWFAWRIATAAPSHGTSRGRPLSFIEAGAFQWVNPKAWTFAIWTTASYAGEVGSALIAAAVFLVTGLASSQAWAVFGVAMGRVLGTGRRLRLFNGAMAALLAGSALWLMLA